MIVAEELIYSLNITINDKQENKMNLNSQLAFPIFSCFLKLINKLLLLHEIIFIVGSCVNNE